MSSRWRSRQWWRDNLFILLIVGLPLALVIYGYVAKPRWMGVADKTLWDWAQLLVAPLVIAYIAFALSNWIQKVRESRELMYEQRNHLQAEEDKQEAALQRYLDLITQLTTNHKVFHTEAGDPVRALAHIRTLMTLEKLDYTRKRIVLRILYETKLIVGDSEQPIVSLRDADLRGADLRKAELRHAKLQGTDLRRSDLRGADLRGTDLTGATLAEVLLSVAARTEEDLRDLSNSYPTLDSLYDPAAELNLPPADLRDAKLDGANLSHAVGVTNVELDQQSASLEGATMPDGQKYEAWLKSREEGGG